MIQENLKLPNEAIAEFCRKWHVREFSLFGSVLRDDFRTDSDVDVLVSFEPGIAFGLWELDEMQEELETAFGRKVDLIEKEALRETSRRERILHARKVVYAA